jgi:hypothetical protein
MSLVIWQPYVFPYLGYFQAIKKCDQFCFLDDVQFIKRGFIHRNSLLVNGKSHRFSIPLKKASQHKKICEVEVADEYLNWKKGFLRSLAFNYGKAPYYSEVVSFVKESLEHQSISEIAQQSVTSTCNYLGLERRFTRSADARYDRSSNAQQKMIDICKFYGHYELLNPIGGSKLYDSSVFDEEGIQLKFFTMDENGLQEFADPSISSLSILHFLFLYPKADVLAMLDRISIQAGALD